MKKQKLTEKEKIQQKTQRNILKAEKAIDTFTEEEIKKLAKRWNKLAHLKIALRLIQLRKNKKEREKENYEHTDTKIYEELE